MLLVEIAKDVDDPVDTNTIRDEIDSRTIPQTNIKSKPEKRFSDDPNSNYNKAKRIRNLAKMKARNTNPSDSSTPTGWNADPHQGSHISTWLNR